MNAPAETIPTLSAMANAPADRSISASRTQLTEQLIGQLIAEQHDLTAVETFSRWHDTAHARDAHADLTHADLAHADLAHADLAHADLAHADTVQGRGKAYQALMPAMPPAFGQQYAFEVNLDTCSGCKACVVACHTLNGLGETETWRKVGILTSKVAKLPVLQHVTTACHHCVDPGCLKGCPVLAYEKDPVTGIVRHLDDQCFGCKYCTMMCPYEVPQYSESLGIVRKCDMCSQRLEQGEAPACVQACPNQAIKIAVVDRDEYQRNTLAAESCLVPTAPPSHYTLPTTRFISQALAESPQTGQFVSRESNEDLVQPGHEPLVSMLVLTQASVGAWLVLTFLSIAGLSTPRMARAGLWTATALGFIGVHLALLHLGRPWLAFRSFLGWRTSWLSREAIVFGMYLPCVFAGLFATYFAPHALGWAGGGASAIGIVAVFCSAMIYVATGRELWSLGRTLGEFAATALGLGVAVATLAMPLASQPSMMVIASCICAAAFLPKWLDWRRSEETQSLDASLSARSGRLLHEPLARAWRIACCSLALSLCVSLLATLWSWQIDGPSDTQRTLAFTLAWGVSSSLLFFSQAMLRWLGFASVVYPRMPGAST